MLTKLLESAREAGAETELVLLRKQDIKLCRGCLTCEVGRDRKPGVCVIKDDMAPLLLKLLEADGVGTKPYVLLRDALAKAGKAAVVKVALRSRETLALIRPVGEVLRLHTMLWPDEIRDDEFVRPPTDIAVSEPELAMAEMLIDQLSGNFDPDAYTDTYREALEKVIEAKLDGVEVPEATDDGPRAEVVDLVAALRASVEAAKARRAVG
jgi:DNA end-binding protein Ku